MGEDALADRAGAEHGGNVGRLVVEQPPAAVDRLDAFALGLGRKQQVLAGVGAAGVWIQVVAVDATLTGGCNKLT
nr:hypothetical protein [Halomicroarcula salinisoli]